MRITTAQKRNIVVTTLLILIVGLSIIATQEPTKQKQATQTEATQKSYTLKTFDPNEATLKELIELGIDKRVAVSIIRYREAGKVFRIKEELAICYGVNDSLYFALEKYIKISDKYKYKKKEFINAAYNNSENSIYAKKESVKFPIEINSADSATLRLIKGVGEKTTAEIIKYRTALGGFHSIEQLAELSHTITESNYEKILTQISANNKVISKIDVNFTPANELVKHPYITQAMARRWISRLQLRQQLKGGYGDNEGYEGDTNTGYSSIEEMIEDNIMNEEAARKLQPYLLFQ